MIFSGIIMLTSEPVIVNCLLSCESDVNASTRWSFIGSGSYELKVCNILKCGEQGDSLWCDWK